MGKKRFFKSGWFQYIQYSIIGISCAAIDLGVLNLLLYFFPSDSTAMIVFYNSIAYSLAVLNSYLLNSKLTFKSRSQHGKKQIITFIIQALISLAISDLIFAGGTKFLSMFETMPEWLVHNISKLVSMFLSSLGSFFFNKHFVFKKKKEQSQERSAYNKK
jgi:putative flippase GtrA